MTMPKDDYFSLKKTEDTDINMNSLVRGLQFCNRSFILILKLDIVQRQTFPLFENINFPGLSY